MKNTVSFNSYVSPSLDIKYAEKPLCGHFIQWCNSYIVEENKKIPLTVALVRSQDGSLFLANPLGMQFHSN